MVGNEIDRELFANLNLLRKAAGERPSGIVKLAGPIWKTRQRIEEPDARGPPPPPWKTGADRVVQGDAYWPHVCRRERERIVFGARERGLIFRTWHEHGHKAEIAARRRVIG